ncbi:MAG: hypothetical protein E7473_05745 [Ruminococcaceae bacterium]|nr:hypothetical protein [Oscillospiraceae bacterium]
MEISKIRRGVICISLSEAPSESFNQIAKKAYEAVGEVPPPSIEITVFSKDGNTLLFANKKETSAIHIGASRRLCRYISN